MNSSEVVLDFLVFLAQVRAAFRQYHMFAEQSAALKAVSTIVIPFKGEPSDYADDGVTISIALNAEVRDPADSEKQAMGMSLLLRHAGGLWLAEAEVGWTGANVGWDPFHSIEAQATSIEEIIDKVPPLINWIGQRFSDEVANLS